MYKNPLVPGPSRANSKLLVLVERGRFHAVFLALWATASHRNCRSSSILMKSWGPKVDRGIALIKYRPGLGLDDHPDSGSVGCRC